MTIDLGQVPSPCFVLEERLLRRNLELIDRVQRRAGVQVILAFKGFSMWSAFPLVRQYLPGATASSLHEARLCFEEMGVKSHTYAAAYIPNEMDEILSYSSHLTFNSLNEYRRYREQVAAAGVDMGIRVNPEYSDVATALYNPTAAGSRLGEWVENFGGEWPDDVTGLHFHALCESDSYTLERVLEALESKFAFALQKVKWVNMGGGHLMTRKGYDLDHLAQVLTRFREKWGVEVILEPGSAIAWETGVLVATVLDVVERHGIKTLMMDISFTAHMPDTLEMPYRPRITGVDSEPKEGQFHYRIGGISCLSGDFMEAYGFDHEVHIGERLVFEDMIHYTMVKTTTFNGVKHPSIATWTEQGELKVSKQFTYEDFKGRLS